MSPLVLFGIKGSSNRVLKFKILVKTVIIFNHSKVKSRLVKFKHCTNKKLWSLELFPLLMRVIFNQSNISNCRSKLSKVVHSKILQFDLDKARLTI